MKKFLYLVLSILGIAYLALFVGYEIYMIKPFIEIDAKTFALLVRLVKYAPAVLVATTLLVYFYGKGLKVVFLIVVILLIIIGVLTVVYPDLFLKIIK